jgi:uncharacterized domain HDIG
MKQVTTALTSFDAALDRGDSATYAHCQRTAGMAVILGRRLGLTQDQLLTLERGVFLHDIGKIHIPERLLKKSGLLEEAEWKVMRGHAVTGYAMLSSNSALTEVAAIVLAHHERYDGTGYPHRLEGDDIPFGAKICAVADCFDMLTSADHSYRRAMRVPRRGPISVLNKADTSIRSSWKRFSPSRRPNGVSSMPLSQSHTSVASIGAPYVSRSWTISMPLLLTTFQQRW